MTPAELPTMQTWKLLIGDVLDQLRNIPDHSVQTVVTSPPYWALRDYGVPGQIGLEPTPEDHCSVMVQVFSEVHRILRDDGTLWMNYGDCYAPTGNFAETSFKAKDLLMMPARVALALQANGWWVRSEIVWHKVNPMPEPVTDRPTSAHEKVYLLTKQPRYFYDADAVREQTGRGISWEEYQRRKKENSWKSGGLTKGAGDNKKDGGFTHPKGRNLRNVWSIPIYAFSEAHFATFPPALVQPCILAGTSEKGACENCGAPWKRQTEDAPEYARLKESRRGSAEYQSGGLTSGVRFGKGTPRLTSEKITTGFKPTCDCDAGTVPCTVFDPFTGSGTTGIVAAKFGRSFVGIELNPEYANLAKDRIGAAFNNLSLKEYRSGQGSLFPVGNNW